MRLKIGHVPRHTVEEETALYHRMKNGDQEARDLLARSVLPWAISCAMKHSGCGLSYDDLEEIAIYSVAETLNRWEPERGRLTTAVPWGVWSNITRQRAQLSGTIPVPVYYVGTEKEALSTGNVEDYEAAKRAFRRGRSLDQQVSSDSEKTWGMTVVDKGRDGRNLVNEMIRQEEMVVMRFKYRWAMDQLSRPRDQQILRMRWEEELTLEEVAERLNLTRERIRQLELRAKQEFMAAIAEAPDPGHHHMSSGTLSLGSHRSEEDGGDDFLASRLPRDIAGSSLVALLGQKTVSDINREIAQLDTQFDRVQAQYQRQKKMLLVLRKALAERDGVSAADAPRKGQDGRTKASNSNTIYGFLQSHPGSSPAEITNATGLPKGTVNTILMTKKGKLFRSVSFGKWEVIPTDEREE